MSSLSQRIMRRVVAPTTVVAAAAAVALVGAGTADAHVSVSSTTATQGGYGLVTLLVPNESDTATTTSLSIAVPNLKSLRTEAMPGWRAVVEKDPTTSEAIRVTWTAANGNPGLKVGEFGQFSVAGGPFPTQASVELPAVQTYSDGEVVNWNQPMGPNGAEPEHPAPTLTLAAGEQGDAHGSHPTNTASDDEQSATSDDTARWIGGIGLILGALGVVFGIGALLRSKRGQTGGGDGA